MSRAVVVCTFVLVMTSLLVVGCGGGGFGPEATVRATRTYAGRVRYTHRMSPLDLGGFTNEWPATMELETLDGGRHRLRLVTDEGQRSCVIALQDRGNGDLEPVEPTFCTGVFGEQPVEASIVAGGAHLAGDRLLARARGLATFPQGPARHMGAHVLDVRFDGRLQH